MTVPELRARADRLPRHERARFLRRISGAARLADAVHADRALVAIAVDIAACESRLATRSAALPSSLRYPAELPITAHRHEILDAVRNHQVVVVAGETGSGKSTQLPKICLELGRGVEGWIGHTQPRRIAARAIAERIAEETGSEVGGLVGYTVRFTDRVAESTLVKVMTDGILLAEIHRDRRLTRYDTIILDEAHERSLNIDFLLGYLKGLLPRRRDLRVIVTSATIDTARFAAYFDGAPVIEVSGRSYPVEVRYRPMDDPSAPPRDQPQAIAEAVGELAADGSGDVLVFCAGEREIRDAIDAVDRLRLRHTETVPLFSRLSAEEQHRVFRAHTGRRVVVATNVAETSLTVPGVIAVVDAGTARISRFSRRTKVQRLPIEPVSRASADQRAGRCGRLGPGVCIRLYSEVDYLSRPLYTEPEVLRTNLASVILQMAALGLGEVESFPFIDPPDRRSVSDGLALLHELGAIVPEREGAATRLTDLGRGLARLPLDPRIGRMVIEADRNHCLSEVTVIASALTIPDPRERPEGEEEKADQLHARFRHPDSDLLSWILLWDHIRGERRERTSASFRRMCRDEFLNYRRVREWQDLHAQLAEVTAEMGMAVNREPADPDLVHRALLTGLLSQVGRKDPEGFEYRGARGARFSIAPGSGLFRRSPPWVMAADLVDTGRIWARGVAPVPPAWVEELGAHLISRSHGDPWWDADRGSAVTLEATSIFGIPLATDRVVQLGRIDPETARSLFIRHALVAGEWETHHRFDARNRAAIEEVVGIETRERRSDLLVDEERLVSFFDRRIPPDITSTRDFDGWWREAEREDPGLLDLTPADLIDPGVPAPDPEAFPGVWRHGDLVFELDYEFDPGSPVDGVTVDVPLAQLERTDPSVFEWHVPGRRAEVIEAMIRSLPKQYRTRLVPIAGTVAEVQAALRPGEESLVQGLRRELRRIGGAPIPPDALDPASLPAHLRPRYRVLGEGDAVLAEGDDLAALKERLAAEARSAIAAGRHPLEQDGLTSWTFGDLPPVVDVGAAGHSARAYPTLVDEGDSVSLRLLATPAEQEAAMRRGSCRLLLVSLPSPAAILRPLLTREARGFIADGPHESAAGWVDDCLMAAAASLVDGAGGVPTDAAGFDHLRALLRDELADAATALGEASLALLGVIGEIERPLQPLADAHREVAVDVAAQVNRLVYPGFLWGIGADRINDVTRYLRAVAHRLQRLPGDPARDSALMARVHRLEEQYDRLMEHLPPTTGSASLAWMLEELRVSLFAQHLGTRGKVSETRIEKALAALLE